jgi:hypothetical protein
MNKNTVRMEGYTPKALTLPSDMMCRLCTERGKTKRGVMKMAYLK